MRAIFVTSGAALLMVSFFMTIPLILEISLESQNWFSFAFSATVTFITGITFIITNKSHFLKLNIRHCYILTISIWLIVSFFCAMPFYLSNSSYQLNFVDAIFESMSGLTTTGSTVYVGLDEAPKGILLWRSLIQWIGGIGLIVFSMTILPYLRVGGMQLFQMESSEKSHNIVLNARKLAKVICLVYCVLTILNIIAYYIAGMNFFDAINHAFATISTGGFSTHDASFAYFESNKIQWVATIFMIAGGTPMLLYFACFRGKYVSRALMAQAQFMYYGIIIVTLVLAVWLVFYQNIEFIDALRLCAFNISSIVTTTGFASVDYSLWGNFAIMIFCLLTIVGGCTGSTSGGIKIFRIQLILKYLNSHIKHLIYPRELFVEKVNYKPMNSELIKSTMVFLIMFISMFLIVALALSFTGLDFITSLSGSATSLANVGPGLGDIIGPAGNFSTLPDSSKYVLIFAMLAGRLEVLVIFVLLSKEFWFHKIPDNIKAHN